MKKVFAVLISVGLFFGSPMAWACEDSEPQPQPQQEYLPAEYTSPPVMAQVQPVGVPVALAGVGIGSAFVLGGLVATLVLRRLR